MVMMFDLLSAHRHARPHMPCTDPNGSPHVPCLYCVTSFLTTPSLAAGAVGAERNNSLQLSLHTDLCNPLVDQSSPQAAGQKHSRLLLTQPAILASTTQAAPEQPVSSGRCTTSEPDQAALIACQGSAQQRPAVLEPAEPHHTSSDAAAAQAHDSVSVTAANSALELPEQVQQLAQLHQPCMLGPGCAAVDAGTAPHVAQQTQPECGIGGIQRQDSSSMMSLSPSLKLDIPGFDDILSSGLLTENDGQAMSQHQQHNQHHGNYQQQQQQQQDSVDQQEPEADGQPKSAERSAYPAGPEAGGATSDGHDALQSFLQDPAHAKPFSLSLSGRSAGVSPGPAVPTLAEVQSASKPEHSRSNAIARENPVMDISLAATQRRIAPGAHRAKEAVVQSPAGCHSADSDAGAKQPDSVLDRPEPLAGGPAQADESSGVAAGAQMPSDSTDRHCAPEAGVQASPSHLESSQHQPVADGEGMRLEASSHEEGQVTSTVAGTTWQASPAAGLHAEAGAACPVPAAEQEAMTDEQPPSSQQTSMTGPQQVRQ